MSRYIRLVNGERHVFGEPFTPDIDAIAFALSHINRYTGHVGPYSVAQHCVLVAMQLPPELQLSGLLHDAPEAYIGDISAPLKSLLPEYKKLEHHYHNTIDRHFDVWTQHGAVQEVDSRMLITEAQHFGLWERDCWPNAEPYPEVEINPSNPKFAECAFLDLYHRLTGDTCPRSTDGKSESSVMVCEPTGGRKLAETILMSKENPTGHKLEDLMVLLQQEVTAKNDKILGDKSKLSVTVQGNNVAILEHLNEIRNLQLFSFELMSKKAPDGGPLGKPRIGGTL